jgi:hypothetical protein
VLFECLEDIFLKEKRKTGYLKTLFRGPNSLMAHAGGNPDEPYTINTAAEADIYTARGNAAQ